MLESTLISWVGQVVTLIHHPYTYIGELSYELKTRPIYKIRCKVLDKGKTKILKYMFFSFSIDSVCYAEDFNIRLNPSTILNVWERPCVKSG